MTPLNANEIIKKNIKTELPGPKAKALLARDKNVITPCYGRIYPFVMAKGRGAEVWDVDGNRFLDFMAGIAVANTGHTHPKVVKAIKNASDNFLHISSDYYHEPMLQLAEKLNDLAPFEEDAMVLFANSGTEAVEGAFKMARTVSGRSRFIGFYGGFHGRTMGSLSFTASKTVQQQGLFPTMPGVTHVPYPNPYRPVLAGDDQGHAVVDYIENIVFKSNVPPNEVAAIVVEPIQGEGGYLVPPASFFPRLRELCDKHGIMLIVDEVQAGVGRTGKMWAIEHFGVEPDVITSAKGLGSGLPIGAVIARKSIMEKWPIATHGNTYGGNPLACAASLATLDLVESEYAANAAKMGDYLMDGLRELKRKHPVIGEIRGKGLMIGMELIKDPETREPAKEFTDKMLHQGFQNGILLLSCGISTFRLMPPLMIDKAIADEALALLDKTFSDVERMGG
ncbi:MAG: aspartate aminotransferase family protein [Anaerolineaceae bacterium 4572_5.2]|nr:MAG: aspartate aminotransferase family protein [Anaerolineaceae bacterium 4572_5.2]